MVWFVCAEWHIPSYTPAWFAHQSHSGLRYKIYIVFSLRYFEIAEQLNGSRLLWIVKPGKCTTGTAQTLVLCSSYNPIPFICTKSCSAQGVLVGGIVREMVIDQHTSTQGYVQQYISLCLDAWNTSNCCFCRWCLEHTDFAISHTSVTLWNLFLSIRIILTRFFGGKKIAWKTGNSMMHRNNGHFDWAPQIVSAAQISTFWIAKGIVFTDLGHVLKGDILAAYYIAVSRQQKDAEDERSCFCFCF